MLTENSMVCDVCGKSFPVMNDDLMIMPLNGFYGHICKDCLEQKKDVRYTTNIVNNKGGVKNEI